jgi:hypothetical protein
MRNQRRGFLAGSAGVLAAFFPRASFAGLFRRRCRPPTQAPVPARGVQAYKIYSAQCAPATETNGTTEYLPPGTTVTPPGARYKFVLTGTGLSALGPLTPSIVDTVNYPSMLWTIEDPVPLVAVAGTMGAPDTIQFVALANGTCRTPSSPVAGKKPAYSGTGILTVTITAPGANGGNCRYFWNNVSVVYH